MVRLRVGVDLDGVVSDFVAGWIERYNAEFGTALRPAEAVDWNAGASLTHFGTTQRFWAWARHCGEGRSSVFRGLAPYPGAVDGLRELLDMAHVAIITTKPTWAVSDTLAWLSELRLPLREVHVTRDKAAVTCDMYVEDSPDHLRSLHRRHPKAVTCRWVRPWNEPIAGVLDVTEWADVHVVARELSARAGGARALGETQRRSS